MQTVISWILNDLYYSDEKHNVIREQGFSEKQHKVIEQLIAAIEDELRRELIKYKVLVNSSTSIVNNY